MCWSFWFIRSSLASSPSLLTCASLLSACPGLPLSCFLSASGVPGRVSSLLTLAFYPFLRLLTRGLTASSPLPVLLFLFVFFRLVCLLALIIPGCPSPRSLVLSNYSASRFSCCVGQCIFLRVRCFAFPCFQRLTRSRHCGQYPSSTSRLAGYLCSRRVVLRLRQIMAFLLSHFMFQRTAVAGLSLMSCAGCPSDSGWRFILS